MPLGSSTPTRSPGDEARAEQRIAELVGKAVELAEGDDALAFDEAGRVAEMKRGAADQSANLHASFGPARLSATRCRSFSMSRA